MGMSVCVAPAPPACRGLALCGMISVGVSGPSSYPLGLGEEDRGKVMGKGEEQGPRIAQR